MNRLVKVAAEREVLQRLRPSNLLDVPVEPAFARVTNLNTRRDSRRGVGVKAGPIVAWTSCLGNATIKNSEDVVNTDRGKALSIHVEQLRKLVR